MTFTLLAADIVVSFHYLGEKGPIARKSKWWVTIWLPTEWKFIAWENTSVEVSLRHGDKESTSSVRVFSCAHIANDSNCESGTRQYGFIDVMDLLEGRKDLMAPSSGGLMKYVLSKSIVT